MAAQSKSKPAELARFSHLAEASSGDWDIIVAAVNESVSQIPERMLGLLASLDSIYLGFPVSQLQHALQAARRAELAGEDDEIVLAALCHDVGKAINVWGHEYISAAMLKPYVGEPAWWVVHNHQVFQSRYLPMYADRHASAELENHPYHELGRRFVDNYDAPSFDPSFETPELRRYEPLVRRLFKEPRDAPSSSEAK